VEKIVFRKVSIPEIIIGQLERGELNFVAAYLGDPRLLEKVVEKNKDLGWQACSTLGNRFFAYNLRRAPLNDVAFRRALAQVIPYEEIHQTVGLGYPIRSNSLINATLKYWFNPNIQMLSYDLEKAKSILKEAGYEWDEDGRLCYPQGQVESLPPAWGP
jgi:peptide/nickel transport system substrate-binding protein